MFHTLGHMKNRVAQSPIEREGDLRIRVETELLHDADRIITVFTPNYGKLELIAKGVRKTTSRKAGHIELFARTQLLLAHGRTFDLITQAELIDPHLPLREDMLRGSMAHYLCELADQFAQEDHEDRALYDLLSDGLLWPTTAADPALSTPFFRLNISYSRLRTTRPIPFDPRPAPWTDAHIIDPFRGRTQVAVDLLHYPISMRWLRFFLMRYVLGNNFVGFQCLVADWMALSRDIEGQRAEWGGRKQTKQRDTLMSMTPRRK